MAFCVPIGIRWRRSFCFILTIAALGVCQSWAQSVRLDPLLRRARAESESAGGISPSGTESGVSGRPVRLLLKVRPGATRADFSARYPGARFSVQIGDVLAGELPASDLVRLAADPDVISAEGARLNRPSMDVVRSAGVDSGNFLGVLDPAVVDFGAAKGSGVIVGIVDTGIDWKHGDFIAEGSPDRSRILFLWDQGDPGGPAPGGAYTTGTQWTQVQINDEIDGAPASIVRSSDTDGHGTHVAAIAAGDGSSTDGDIAAGTFVGMAPEADIIVVKTTFFDSDILAGVQYVFDKAAAMGKRAVVNLSLGNDIGPHDGTGAFDSALNTIAASSPVVVSAGNSQGDTIHASSMVAPGGSVTFQLTRRSAVADFIIDFWMPSGDAYTVAVATQPSGGMVISAAAGVDVTSQTLQSTSVDIYNTLGAHPSGDRQALLSIRQSPSVSHNDFYVTFTRTANGGSGRIDGWISNAGYDFANYVSSSMTLGSPGVAANVITVGSYCSKRSWIDTGGNTIADTACAVPDLGKLSDFSGLGPTRDGRIKPDISAPGEYVASALSSFASVVSNVILQDDRHTMLQGTSMAAPVVAAMAAIDLQRFPEKSAAAVKATLQTNARSDTKVAAAGSLPNNLWGYGKAKHFACLATAITTPTAITPFVLGHSSISYVWAASNFASSYNVYYATSPTTLISNVAGPSFTYGGLAADTTYAIKIHGNSPCGEGPGAVSVSTRTGSLPPLAAAPGAPSGTAVDATTIQWSWPPLVFADSYDVYPASNPSGAAINTASPGFFHSNLASNTAYGITVAGRNDAGAGPLSVQTTVYTQAAPPADLAASAVYVTSASLAWGLNGNPAQTTATLERSTDDATFAAQFNGAATAFVDTGLAGCTSYYYRVRNVNGDEIPTSYHGTLNFITQGSTPTAPSSLKAESVGGRRISLTWSGSPSGRIEEYALYYDSGTGGVDYGVSFATVPGSVTSYTTPALPGLETVYRFGVRAKNDCGLREGNTGVTASAAALEALTGLRAAVTVPPGGRKITGDRVTVAAQMSLGSASETSSVRFEYKASSAAVWSAIPAATANHPNPDTDFPYAVHWNVLVLDATSYDLRAVATSVSAGTDAFASVVSVVVDHADPDINETSQAGGRIRKQERIHNGVANAVETTDEGTSMSTRVSLPSGSLSESTVTLTIVQNPSTALNPPGDAIDLGLRAEISLSNGQTQLAGGNLATLVFSYPDEDGNGLVDGTAIRADDLKVYVYDLTSGAWQLEFGSTVDTSAKTVSAQTPHFSFFASFAPAFTSLSDVRIYPNPYRPNSGSADDGREFSAGDQNSGIIFDRLPPDFTIDILTISGNRVKTLRPSGGGSRFRWDVLNESGAKTSSGVYFAVISSPDSDTVVRKVAIIR